MWPARTSLRPVYRVPPIVRLCTVLDWNANLGCNRACIRNAILDHSLPGVHGALLLLISIALSYRYSVGLSIDVVLARCMCSYAKPPVYLSAKSPEDA